LLLLTPVRAQESLRMSLASSAAAEARRRAAATIGYYNLQLGPTAWRFGTSLGLEYDSDINYGPAGQSDFIVRPQINTQLLWPITVQNSLNLNLGLGYSAYIENPRFNRAFITPGSEVSFDLYVGNLWINLHDRFSITEDAYQDPTVAGAGNYSQLQNALGIAPVWDLNKIIVRAGYDHVNYIELTGSAGRPDGQSEVFSSSVGYALKPGVLTGIEVGGALIRYTATGTNIAFSDASQWNAGLFYETQVSEYMHFRASGGYTVYSPETSGVSGATGDFTGYYAQLGLSHKVNQYLEYTLSAGRSINFAFYGGNIDEYYAQLNAQWKFMRKTSISTSLEYEHGSQVGFAGETFDRYGGGISAGRPITSKLSSSLGYQFYWRGSDVAGRDYLSNIVSLTLAYQF
jgi:hypothetical protein